MRVAVQLLVFPIVGRQIGPEGIGQIALTAPFICLAMMFSEAGLGTALIRAPTLTPELEGTVFTFSLAASGATVAAFALAAVPLAQVFHAPQFAGLLIGMSSSLILASFNVVPSSLLLREKRYGAVASSDAVSTLLGLAAVVGGLTLGLGVYSLVAQQAVSWLSRAVFGAFAIGWRPKLALRRALLSEHLGLGASLTGASVFAFLGKNADSFMLAWFFGERSLGFYALAFQIVTIPQMVTSGSSYLTALGRVSESERLRQSSADIYLGGLRSTILVCAPMVAGMALVAPLAVSVVLGPTWGPSVPLIVLLAPYGFCETLWPSLSGVIRGHGRGGLILGLGVCNGILTAVAILGSAWLGSGAVAAAVSASAVSGLMLGLVLINRVYGLPFARVADLFVPPSVAVLTMCAVVSIVLPTAPEPSFPAAKLALQIALGASTYFAALIPFRGRYRIELDALRRFLAHGHRSGRRRDGSTPAGPRPKVGPAVVVVSRGRPDLLGRTVDHLRRQTLAPGQIIVSCGAEADAGSVAARPGIEVVYGPPGLTCQRNRGLRAVRAETDIVVFFDDDFVPHEGWLAAALEAFAARPDVGSVTGDLLADGGKGPGLTFDGALALLEGVATPTAHWTREGRKPYGCNMAFRADLVKAVGFDERLTHYGWLEDADIGGALQNMGWRSIQIGAAVGVHMGVKTGRTPGHLLGYSQVMNPLYLYRKGTLRFKDAVLVLSRNVINNATRSLAPEPYIDRRGRLSGNVAALRLVLRGRLCPEHQPNHRWPNAAGAVPGEAP